MNNPWPGIRNSLTYNFHDAIFLSLVLMFVSFAVKQKHVEFFAEKKALKEGRKLRRVLQMKSKVRAWPFTSTCTDWSLLPKGDEVKRRRTVAGLSVLQLTFSFPNDKRNEYYDVLFGLTRAITPFSLKN